MKLLDTSVTKAAQGSMDSQFTGSVADNVRSACAASLNSIDDARVTTMHTIATRDRKAAIVLAAVKAEAPTRRPDGRPGPPLRAPLGRDEGIVRVLTEQRNDKKFAI